MPRIFECTGNQYTIRHVPTVVDVALRQRARAENRSLNDVAVEALMRGAGVAEDSVRYRRLDDLAGTWEEDPRFEQALTDQDTIDADVWR